MILGTVATQNAGNPATQLLVNAAKKESMFIAKLYSLVPQDSNSVENLPLIIESKPNMSYYCIKNISVNRLQQQEYERIKALQVYRQSFIQSQSLAPVHFSPENILKRTNFRPVKTESQAADADATEESKGKL